MKKSSQKLQRKLQVVKTTVRKLDKKELTQANGGLSMSAMLKSVSRSAMFGCGYSL